MMMKDYMTDDVMLMMMMETYWRCCPETLASASLSATIEYVDNDDNDDDDGKGDDDYDDDAAFEYLGGCVHACIRVRTGHTG